MIAKLKHTNRILTVLFCFYCDLYGYVRFRTMQGGEHGKQSVFVRKQEWNVRRVFVWLGYMQRVAR